MARKYDRIILESPCKGASENERVQFAAYRDLCLRDSVVRGEAPFASHRMYVGPLDDDDPEEREAGIEAGYAWWGAACKVAFYVDYGFSPGMQLAYDRAVAGGYFIEERRLYGSPETRVLAEGRRRADDDDWAALRERVTT